jgi:cell division protein FtsQ
LSVTKPVRKNQYKKEKSAPKAPARRLAGVWLKAFLGAAGFCLAGVIFIFGYDALTQCDYFRASAITVNGERRLAERMILDAADIQYGDNILAVNLGRVRKRLVAEPWIKEAGIRRELPSRMIIRIEEHQPLAVLDVGRCFLIDQAGDIFKEAAPAEMSGLPIIAGIDYADWKSPENPETKIYTAVMAMLKALDKNAELFGTQGLHEISVDPEMGLTLRARAPVASVHMGYGAYGKKLKRVGRVFARLQAAPDLPAIQALDAHNPDRLIATPTARNTSEQEKEV